MKHTPNTSITARIVVRDTMTPFSPYTAATTAGQCVPQYRPGQQWSIGARSERQLERTLPQARVPQTKDCSHSHSHTTNRCLLYHVPHSHDNTESPIKSIQNSGRYAAACAGRYLIFLDLDSCCCCFYCYCILIVLMTRSCCLYRLWTGLRGSVRITSVNSPAETN